MSKTHLALYTALGALLLAGAFVWWMPPNEPAYHGRRLSSWLRQWEGCYYVRTDESATAIRAIGTNGVPLLLAWMSKDRTYLQKNIIDPVGRYLPDGWNPMDRDAAREIGAAEALSLLGPEAQSAFPALTNLLTKRASMLQAAIALTGMGREGVQILCVAATDRDWHLRFMTATALEGARSDFDIIVPSLMAAAKMGGQTDADYLARDNAGTTLILLHKESDSVVAEFTAFLTNEIPRMRICGADLLGRIGPEAISAAPLLRKAAADEDAQVREAAQTALKKISLGSGNAGGTSSANN